MPDNVSQVSLAIQGTLATSSVAGPKPIDFPADIVSVVAAVQTAPTGADLLIDLLKNGASVFTSYGTIAPGSAMGVGDTTLYMEFTGNGQPDIRQGQTLLIQSEQLTVSGQPQGSSKVDGPNPVYAIPVTRGANGTTAATHAAGVAVSPAKVRIPAGQTRSAAVEVPPYGNTPLIAAGDVLTIAITQVGSTVAGSGLEVSVELDQR